MAGKGGSSILSNMSSARKRVQATQAEMFGRGQQSLSTANVQRPLPPAQPPAQPASAEVAAAPVEDEAVKRQRLVGKVQSGLDQMQIGGATPAQGGPVQSTDVAGGTPETLMTQLESLQATKLSPEVQFYRLAGRQGSPREIAAYSTRMMLEQQLGRPPTRGEIRLALTRPETMTVSTPTAFEA